MSFPLVRAILIYMAERLDRKLGEPRKESLTVTKEDNRNVVRAEDGRKIYLGWFGPQEKAISVSNEMLQEGDQVETIIDEEFQEVSDPNAVSYRGKVQKILRDGQEIFLDLSHKPMPEPTEQNPPPPEPEPANASAQEGQPAAGEESQEPQPPPAPEPASESPNVAEGRGEKSRDRLDAGALRQEMSRKFQAYERPKLPEIKAESVPKLLKLVAEIRDAKEREMVEAWARANDDVIKDKFPGVKTVSHEMHKQLIKEVEGEAYFAEEDETGEYRQLEVVFFDLDENRVNASPETLISLVHFLNRRQTQLGSERANAETANNQEELQRINERMRDYLLLEEDAHRVISGGEIPDVNVIAEGLITGKIDSRWQAYLAQPVSDQAILARQAQLGNFLPARHIQVLQELGYTIQPVYKKNKRTLGLTSRMVGVRVVDSAGNSITNETPVNLATRLLNNEFRQKKSNEFKAELLPDALQEVKIGWLRDNFIDTSRLEEQFEIAEKEIMSKTLTKRIERAQRRAGNREQVKDYKETLENQGLDMKRVIKDLMESEPQDEEEALRNILRSHGFEGDEYYNAFSSDDKQALFSAKKRGVGYWVTTFMNFLNKLPI